ncbi:FG-GAP-like repeat-containing protein, partial [Pyxidicoccus sp. 3LFB2]
RSARTAGPEREAVVEGLTNGAPATFTVRAVNAVGEGPESAVSEAVVPLGPPRAPTSVFAEAHIRSAWVFWEAPTDTGGLHITGYVVTASPGGHSRRLEATATGAFFDALDNGTAYTFTVAALNDEGTGTGASAAEVRTRPLPDAPSAVVVTPGLRSLTVTWGAPASEAVEPTTGYTVVARPAGTTRQVGPGVREVTFASVPSSEPQVITVTAHNAVGEGPAASSVRRVRPLPEPVEVTSLSVSLEASGCGTVSYGLRQRDGDRADVLVEVDAEGDGSFTRATQAGSLTHSGLTALAAAPTGSAHAFAWNRSEDRPGAAPSALVRVTATVPGSAPATRTVAVPLEAMTRRCEWTFDRAPTLVQNRQGGLAYGDFDRDGKVDIALSHYFYPDTRTREARVARGQGNGHLTMKNSNALRFGGDLWNTHLASADLDGDGVLDLVAFDFFGSEYTGFSTRLQVTVARGFGDGSFDRPVTRVLAEQVPRPATVLPPLLRDLDGDELPEVIVSGNGALYVLRYSDGALSVAFTEASVSGGSVAAGDFDEDGREDLLVAGESLQLFRGQGQLGFTPELLGSMAGPAHSAVAGDFNGDGHLDLAASLTEDTRGVIHLLPGDGAGRFGAAVRLPYHPRNYSPELFVGDLDVSGTQDLAYVDGASGNVTLLLGRGDGTFEPRALTMSTGPIIGAADFDGSGGLDLLVGNWNGAMVLKDPTAPRPQSVGSSAVFADFNADGWEDIVSVTGPGTVQVHFTRAEGGLQPSTPSPAPQGSTGLRLGRFDPGPTLDLLVMASTGGSTPAGILALMRGNADGTFSAGEALAVGAAPYVTAAGDVDDDGDLDIVCGTARSEGGASIRELRLLRNGGDGTFGPGVVMDRRYAELLAMGDLNLDGRADLVVMHSALGKYVSGPVVTLYSAQVDGTLTYVKSASQPDCPPRGMVLRDSTQDGYLDVIVTCAPWDLGIARGFGGTFTFKNLGAP